MRRSSNTILIFLLLGALPIFGQTITLNPTISPALFRYSDQITVTYDVTGTSLSGLTAAWIWAWMPGISGSATNATSNVNPATSNAPLTNAAKCTKSTAGGKTTFSITFTPSAFFSTDISSQTLIGILLKGNDWSNGQTTDYVVNFLIGNTFQTTLSSPTLNPLFVNNGDSVIVQASASSSAKFILVINGQRFDSALSVTNYRRKLIASDSANYYVCNLIVSSGSNVDTLIFNYLFSQSSPSSPRPSGIIDGINYSAIDQTKVTLCFWAPGKTSVYAFGDFTDWNVSPTYLMNRDGEHFWIEVDGLVPGKEYAFQYLVNDSLKIADPYTDKTLDYKDDLQIPSSTYPNLLQYPAKAVNSQWYFNRLSVFQTGQTPYQWQTNSYQKPAKEKLVIYEVLIRDFFDGNHRNFQSLIDTLSYFKRLGVNAIELMPIAEFNGEIGWGYNPTFMFAVQKYYGTKNKLKEFVDKCHGAGIAVIMDLVMNHQDLPNSYAMLDYDFVAGKPKPSNKWFNPVAPHPYSVFNDLNHESPYTRKYLDTINYYWIHEFKIDGFRYDLSKGFTQFNSGSDVNLWSEFDPSRVSNLDRMANVLWSKFPDAYIILEHFADNTEETSLADYQVAQGKGMMLWENFNSAYNQNTMGYSSGSDISQMYYANKGWTAPRAVGYMESHDEERLMYKNEQYGNASGSYSTKDIPTSLQRMKAAALMFYTIPGPKMLWEFGELGYDQSINECVNGTVDASGNCRLDSKPVLWSYLQDANRKSLWNHIQDLLRLRKNYNLFTTAGTAQISSGASSLVQQITLKNTPYTSTPTDSSQMNVQIIANFDVVSQSVSLTFPHSGTWYDYYNHEAPTAVTGSLALTLQPGEFRMYTDVNIKPGNLVLGVKDDSDAIVIFPNPAKSEFFVKSDQPVLDVHLTSILGIATAVNPVGDNAWSVGSISPGVYIVEVLTASGIVRKKLIKD